MAETGGLRQRQQGNGELKTNVGTHSAFQQQLNLQRIRDQAQRLQTDLLSRLNREIEDHFESFISEVDQIEEIGEHNGAFSPGKQSRRKKSKDELPDKEFTTRRSLLTDLLEINHIRTIYHIFVAILIVFSLNTLVYDLIDKGVLDIHFELIQWGLGKFPKVMATWMSMQLSTLLIVYPGFHYWSTMRKPGPATMKDYVALTVFVCYQTAFLVLPVKYAREHELPPASAVIIMTEQLRMIMKVHSFIRENVPKVLDYKTEAETDNVGESETEDKSPCPDFSKFLYFLFAPTLVYRDSYPRTPTIRWNYVVSNFAQVLACLFYTYYIFMRFCVPFFRNFNQEHVTPKALLLSVFGCMLPGTLVLFIGFFAILHSWLNAFAEMLRFGDRMFYKDWWNSTTFASYYRTWNIVVHDWLYCYIYKDFYKLLGPKYRHLAMALVFFISAIFHEYVLIMAFNFFYPVLFTMFMGAGFAFMFLTNKGVSRSWNVFMWVALFIGNGLLMCLYSMEWYARQNCPANPDSFLDVLIPRSWTCNFDGITLQD